MVERKLMKKNKKAIFYSVTILLFTIIILTGALTITFKKTTHEKKIGEEQIKLIQKYQEGENALFYIDQAAKYSVYSSIYLFAKNGTYFDEPPCKRFSDKLGEYLLWKTRFKPTTTQQVKEESCYPSKKDLIKNFNLFLNDQLDKYTIRYPTAVIPLQNYDFTYKENKQNIEIIGIPSKKIRIPDLTQYKEEVWPTLTAEEQNCFSKEKHVLLFFIGESIGCKPCLPNAECEDYIKETYCQIDPCDLGCIWEEKCEKITSIYTISPSFKTQTTYNFIDKFQEYVEKTKEIEENIKECLKKGSYKEDDADDFVTCVERLKTKEEDNNGGYEEEVSIEEAAQIIPYPDAPAPDDSPKDIEGIENYKITPITSEPDKALHEEEMAPIAPDHGLDPPPKGIELYSSKVYTLLFDIEDPSFQNPYSDEKLIIKYGISFIDEFPPPATEIITDKDNKPLRKDGIWYIVFKNKASDIVYYKVYYKNITKSLDGRDIPSRPPTEINDMYNWDNPFISINSKLPLNSFKEGDYYFFAIAIDDTGNPSKEVITKRISIPSIENVNNVPSIEELFPGQLLPIE